MTIRLTSQYCNLGLGPLQLLFQLPLRPAHRLRDLTKQIRIIGHYCDLKTKLAHETSSAATIFTELFAIAKLFVRVSCDCTLSGLGNRCDCKLANSAPKKKGIGVLFRLGTDIYR
jgi:hypothetical protein